MNKMMFKEKTLCTVNIKWKRRSNSIN